MTSARMQCCRYEWSCPICGRTVHGNGGTTKHQASHLVAAGLPSKPVRHHWQELLRQPALWAAARQQKKVTRRPKPATVAHMTVADLNHTKVTNLVRQGFKAIVLTTEDTGQHKAGTILSKHPDGPSAAEAARRKAKTTWRYLLDYLNT